MVLPTMVCSGFPRLVVGKSALCCWQRGDRWHGSQSSDAKNDFDFSMHRLVEKKRVEGLPDGPESIFRFLGNG